MLLKLVRKRARAKHQSGQLRWCVISKNNRRAFHKIHHANVTNHRWVVQIHRLLSARGYKSSGKLPGLVSLSAGFTCSGKCIWNIEVIVLIIAIMLSIVRILWFGSNCTNKFSGWKLNYNFQLKLYFTVIEWLVISVIFLYNILILETHINTFSTPNIITGSCMKGNLLFGKLGDSLVTYLLSSNLSP